MQHCHHSVGSCFPCHLFCLPFFPNPNRCTTSLFSFSVHFFPLDRRTYHTSIPHTHIHTHPYPYPYPYPYHTIPSCHLFISGPNDHDHGLDLRAAESSCPSTRSPPSDSHQLHRQSPSFPACHCPVRPHHAVKVPHSVSRKQKVARGRAVWTAVTFSSGTQDPLLPSTQTGHNHHKTQKETQQVLVISNEQHQSLGAAPVPLLIPIPIPSRHDSALGLCSSPVRLSPRTYSSLQSVSNIIPPQRPALPLLNLAHRLLASFVSAS